ncbi:MAG: DUF134 domain-containing protein [bacterium]|nr:DUF134 domain-containing protein [bacterium]
MPRPKKFRFISYAPAATYFKPSGVPRRILEEVNLEPDELEAVRLADFEGLYQEDAAKRMNVSRQTFGNILVSAHKKIADAIVRGKVLRIEKPSEIIDDEKEKAECRCGYRWKENVDAEVCPACNGPRNSLRMGRGRRRRQFK